MIVLKGKEGVLAYVGKDIGTGPWMELTQDRINTFAKASGDYQWIHVDEERAKSGPYKKTIAHGVLTLAMLNDLTAELFKFEGFKMTLNYGYEKIRFPAPAPVGSKLRGRAKVLSCEDASGGAIHTLMELTVEIDGSPKPACVAQMIFRHIP